MGGRWGDSVGMRDVVLFCFCGRCYVTWQASKLWHGEWCPHTGVAPSKSPAFYPFPGRECSTRRMNVLVLL